MRKFAWMERIGVLYKASKLGSERGSFAFRGPLMDANGDGDGGGGGGGDDQPLKRADIIKLVNDTVNGTVSRIEKETKKQFTQITETLSGLVDKIGSKKEEPPAGDDGEGKSKVDPKVIAQLENERKARERLEKQVNDLLGENKKTKEEAELKERLAEIKSAMSKFSFANEGTRDMAFEYFAGKIKRGEDGALVAPGKDGEVPYDHFIKGHLESNPNLLAAKQSGGGGATGGEPYRGSKFDASVIKPGMTSDQRKAAAAALLQARGQ